MFRFVTKHEYWSIVDSGVLADLPPLKNWHLKSIQDAVAYSFVKDCRSKSIGEIGGGVSRILRPLSKSNTCFNIEDFQGSGGGPTSEHKIRGVENILAKVGDFNVSLKENQFDILLSISVVEHVPDALLKPFFLDCFRIIKPGGTMVHLIDVYLEDHLGDNHSVAHRVESYREFTQEAGFHFVEPPDIEGKDQVTFRSSFATNPDTTMEQWNRAVPALRQKRERAQSCTLLLVATA